MQLSHNSIRLYQLYIIQEMEFGRSDPSVSPVFHFQKMKNINNKLVNKKLNVVLVDQKLNTVECKDTQAEPTVTRAEHPLTLENSASYFEVEILKTTEEDVINVGLITKDSNNKQFLGKSMNSIGYLKGAIYMDKKKIANSPLTEKLKEGDRIGLGVNCYKRTFFAVKNGLIILKAIEIPINWNEYIPAVSLTNQHQKVKFHFNHETFQFKLNDYCKGLQSQLKAQIENANTFTNNQIYSLVHEYLSFNRYNQTLSLCMLSDNTVNQKKIDFHRLSKYTKNPSIPNPSIDLQKKNEKSKVGQDQQMNEPLKARGRIMSERLNQNDEEQFQIRRKATEMNVEDQNVRKCSMISNMSNISNVPLSNLSQKQQCFPELQQEKQEKINQNEAFLDGQRHQIIQLIKDMKILEAIDRMQATIPNIFDDNYVLAFMKAHVFLQKIKQQSNKEAIIYSKKQKEIFKTHYGTLCPFYNSLTNTTEWKPLSTIFSAMAYNTQTECKLPQNCSDMLSQKQFLTFAQFINKLILNKMGYLACSRLTYFTSHMKKIQEKLREVRGMNCGIEFKA